MLDNFENISVPPFDEEELTNQSTQSRLCSIAHCEDSSEIDCGNCLFHHLFEAEFEVWKRQKLEQLNNE